MSSSPSQTARTRYGVRRHPGHFPQGIAGRSRHLGYGGVDVGGTDERQSVATIRAALDQGISLIDTAPAYGFGVSEEIVGKALTGIRSRAIIATKVGLEWRDGKVYRNATRNRIMAEIDASLRRLRTDYIDIYQVHWPDPLVPWKKPPGRCASCTNRERSAPSA